jgi:hypothetical protein
MAVAFLAAPAQGAGADLIEVGKLPKESLPESSGLVASRQHPGTLWTHNDGQDRRLFAVNRQGKVQAVFELQTVFIWDWEDLAIGSSNRIYVADTGNNLEIRPSLIVHEIEEPDPSTGSGILKPKRSWVLKFPGKSFDAEGLVVWGNHGYLIEKKGKDKKAPLHRWALDGGASPVMEEIGKLEVRSPVTGADLSPDGRRLALTADDGVYLIEFDGGMEKSVSPEPFHIPFTEGQIEGCAFVDDGLLVSSEKQEMYLFRAAPLLWRANSR